MKLNFFDWIREGVRQSILLGISDAADQLGSPADVEPLQTQLLQSIQQQKLVASPTRGGGSKRKALGRSLSPIVDEAS